MLQEFTSFPATPMRGSGRDSRLPLPNHPHSEFYLWGDFLWITGLNPEQIKAKDTSKNRLIRSCFCSPEQGDPKQGRTAMSHLRDWARPQLSSAQPLSPHYTSFPHQVPTYHLFMLLNHPSVLVLNFNFKYKLRQNLQFKADYPLILPSCTPR